MRKEERKTAMLLGMKALQRQDGASNLNITIIVNVRSQILCRPRTRAPEGAFFAIS